MRKLAGKLSKHPSYMHKNENPMTFGQVVAAARKRASLNQRQLAGLIKKEDGQPISHPYLNDIEHGRRNPPSDFLIEQFAAALHLPSDLLFYWAGRVPPDVRGLQTDSKVIVDAYKALRKALKGNSQSRKSNCN